MAWSNSNVLALAQGLNIFFYDPVEPTQLRIITTPSQVSQMEWSHNNLLLALSAQGEQVLIYKSNNFCINDYELEQPIDIENVVFAKWIQGENPSFLAVAKNGRVHAYELGFNKSFSNYFNTGLTVDKVDISIKDEINFIIAISEKNSCLIHIFEWNLVDSIHHYFIQLSEIPKKLKLLNYGDLYIKYERKVEKRPSGNYKMYLKLENEDPFYDFQNISYSNQAVSPNKSLICFLTENTLLFYLIKLKDIPETIKTGLKYQYDLTDIYINLHHFEENELPKFKDKELDMFQFSRYEKMKYAYNYLGNPSQNTILYHQLKLVHNDIRTILYSKNLSSDEPKQTNVETSKIGSFKENIEWIKKYVLLYFESVVSHYKDGKTVFMSKFIDQEKRFQGFTSLFKEIICGAYYLCGETIFIPIWNFLHQLLIAIKEKIDHPKIVNLCESNLKMFGDLKKSVKLDTIESIYSSLHLDPPLNGIFSIDSREPILIDIITKEKLNKTPYRKCRFCGYMTSYIMTGYAIKYEVFCPICYSNWKRVE